MLQKDITQLCMEINEQIVCFGTFAKNEIKMCKF